MPVSFLCVMLDSQLGVSWLSRIVAPTCLLPAASVAGYLAQHIDKTKKAAVLIGAPTIAAMSLMIGFSFYLFSPLGERQLRSAVFSVTAIAALGIGCAGCYLVGLCWALLRRAHPAFE